MRVAFTGHRELDIFFDRKILRDYISFLISKGADTFYVGMARGFDLEALYQLSLIKTEKKLSSIPDDVSLLDDYYKEKKDSGIKIIGCYPFKNHNVRNTNTPCYTFASLEESLDEKIYCSPFYHEGCMNARNKYMVDNCDMLIAYYNPSKTTHSGTLNTIRMAIEAGVPYYNIIDAMRNKFRASHKN